MRRLIVQQWVTVDNIAAEEDGGLSFVSGEPFSIEGESNEADLATLAAMIEAGDGPRWSIVSTRSTRRPTRPDTSRTATRRARSS